MAKAKKENKTEMENILFKGTITATSNRTSEKFKAETPTKACYVKFATDADIELAENFGIKMYTADGATEPHAVIRASKNIAVYNDGVSEPTYMDGGIADFNGVVIPNFRIAEDKIITMNVIKSEKSGHEFYRLQALLMDSMDDIETLKPNNPFANLFGDNLEDDVFDKEA